MLYVTSTFNNFVYFYKSLVVVNKVKKNYCLFIPLFLIITRKKSSFSSKNVKRNVLEIKQFQSSCPLEVGCRDDPITIVLTPAYNLFRLQPFSESKFRPLQQKYCLGQKKFSRGR